jgi:hypothetical protein
MFRGMPDLDLEPKNYRAEPLKGEKVFAPGGLKRIGLYLGFVAFAIVFVLLIRGPYDWLFNILWPAS